MISKVQAPPLNYPVTFDTFIDGEYEVEASDQGGTIPARTMVVALPQYNRKHDHLTRKKGADEEENDLEHMHEVQNSRLKKMKPQ